MWKGWSQECREGAEEWVKCAWRDWGIFRGEKNCENLSSFELDDVVLNVQSAGYSLRKHTLCGNVEFTAEGDRTGVLGRLQRLG